MVIEDMALPPHSFAERFVRGNILDRAWSLAVAGLGLVTSFITLWALSVSDFGRYQLVLAAVAFVTAFSVDLFDEVIQSDVSCYIAEGRRGEAKRLFIEFAALKIGFGLLITAVLFFGAGPVARAYGGEAVQGYIRIISFLFVLRSVRMIASLLLKSVVSLKALGASAVEEGLKLALVAVAFFMFTLGIREVLLAAVAGAAVAMAYILIQALYAYQRVFSGIKAAGHYQLVPAFRRYGGLVLFRTALHRAAKPMRPWLIKGFVGTEAVALYALAVNLVTLIKDFIPLVGVSLVSWELGNHERLRTIFIRGAKYSFWVGLGAYALFGAVMPGAVWLILPKYLTAMPLFLLLLISLPFHGISRLEYSLLTAFREQKLLTARLIVEIVMSFVTLILLLPVIGLTAVAVEVNGAIIWRVWYLQRALGRKYPYLKLNLSAFFRFDEEDRVIFRRGFTEMRLFFRKNNLKTNEASKRY